MQSAEVYVHECTRSERVQVAQCSAPSAYFLASVQPPCDAIGVELVGKSPKLIVGHEAKKGGRQAHFGSFLARSISMWNGKGMEDFVAAAAAGDPSPRARGEKYRQWPPRHGHRPCVRLAD